MQKETQMADAAHPNLSRRLFWAATLIAASVAFSLGFACAVPLAAFAAFAALTTNRVEALLLVLAVFLANQCVGFGFLHYPHTTETYLWGVALGVVSLAATLGVASARDRLPTTLGGAGAAFLVAFCIYECLLFAATAISGEGFDAYTGPMIARIFGINAAAFLGLLTLYRFAIFAGWLELSQRLLTQKPV